MGCGPRAGLGWGHAGFGGWGGCGHGGHGHGRWEEGPEGLSRRELAAWLRYRIVRMEEKLERLRARLRELEQEGGAGSSGEAV
ncbi:hypothetical protein [Limnochorda pilosa]|uniref:DUF5320 domain-containing protein n=1 Tax=Limnochorda pilosa TaxID=1555112 RepID=A0A0K2SH86_LIMPI|nr:hypothetical protein [Limnochorda pilosa]BAS26483.1 hypothetical protein LIP_0626 [Limnochorda pilosa]